MGRLSSTAERMRIARGVRDFMERNYDLRYNVMKQTEEFRPKNRQDGTCENYDGRNFSYDGPNLSNDGRNSSNDGADWRQLTDREMRRIAIEQMEQVGVAWSVDVELYVRSALVPPYNPVSDYLAQCGAWDGRDDPIRRMATRVPTRYREWSDLFHRWLLAMVAQWMNLSRDFGNAVVPLLIGGQGTRKSTFCKLILPPELREYYIDDVKMDSAALGQLAMAVASHNAPTHTVANTKGLPDFLRSLGRDEHRAVSQPLVVRIAKQQESTRTDHRTEFALVTPRCVTSA